VAVSYIGSTNYTSPGNLGEGSLVFIITVDRFLNRHETLSSAANEAKAVYMDFMFGQLDPFYDDGLPLMNFFGFSIYGDPALRYPEWQEEN
jgi:hypothetical protein